MSSSRQPAVAPGRSRRTVRRRQRATLRALAVIHRGDLQAAPATAAATPGITLRLGKVESFAAEPDGVVVSASHRSQPLRRAQR
jgi:hypothetical protein